MKKDSPYLSVVMSVYNGQTFLSEAIESILAQSYRDFEFIVVDDGSTDKSAEIVDSQARRDSRIRFYPLGRNGGLANALNFGIEKATGDVIARMDADDVALPERFDAQLSFMGKTGADVAGTWDYKIDAGGRRGKPTQPPESHENIQRTLPRACAFLHPTVMMRKSIVDAAGGYDPAFTNAEDYDLWLRLMPVAQMCNLGQPMVLRRKHGNRISANRAKLAHFSTCAALNHLLRGRGMPSLVPSCGAKGVVAAFSALSQAGLGAEDAAHLQFHATNFAHRSLREPALRAVLQPLVWPGSDMRSRLTWRLDSLRKP